MIRFTLKCAEAHSFESWFQSNEVFEGLRAAGHVTCPTCGTSKVEKTLMAPRVSTSKSGSGDLAAPKGEVEKAIAAMRKEVEDNSEFVGLNFASEARAIHDGDAPDRAIYGEAHKDEAKKLIEDGVPVAPLPFVPKTKTN